MPYIFHNESAADRFADDCVRQHNVGRKRAKKPVLKIHPEIVRTTVRVLADREESGSQDALRKKVLLILSDLQKDIDNPKPPPPPPSPKPAAAPNPKRDRPRKTKFR